MAMRKKPSALTKAPELQIRGYMRDVGGSEDGSTNAVRLIQAFNTAANLTGSAAERNNLNGAACNTLAGIKPADDIEGMLAGQMLAVHNASMECFRRAMVPGEFQQVREYNLSAASKLARTYTLQMEALQRHRGKGQQKVTVEHVHIYAGGQAIVGAVGTP